LIDHLKLGGSAVTVGHARAPFLDFQSFQTEVAEAPEPEVRALLSSRSPFISVYELVEGENAYDDPLREAYATIVNELHDEEFDEALFELQTHARALHDNHLFSGASRIEADRALTQHFSQLIRESEAMVDAMAHEFGTRDQNEILQSELEGFQDRYASSVTLDPEFENFFGKVFKKVSGVVRKVASKALGGITKLGLRPVLDRIKRLLKPLLNKVLQKAIGKLPVAVQPAAQMLARKLGFAAPAAAPTEPAADTAIADAGANSAIEAASAPDAVGSPVQPSAGDDPGALQQEFDEQIAQMMLAQDEVELDMEVAQIRTSAESATVPAFAELDDAREQFIQELEGLKEGESAEPYIQNFLPAVLPALRIGIRLIGRPRVVKFLAQLLARMITKLVGPAAAPALSQAMVDAGLKLLNLEMSEQEKSGLAASAVAATVEETVNRVASLPEHILDNQELFEAFALEAFEQAAASNLPPVLSDETYRQRPGLLEAGVNAGWVLMPLRGRKRYKKCSRTFKVRISPHMAEEVEGFEGEPLSEYFQDQLGMPEGDEVQAEVHLYETLPGTTAADIARGETATPGLGAADEATVSQLQPLTRQAASVLLGRPGLGRELLVGAGSHNLAAGQRLFHMAIPGKRPLTALADNNRPHLRQRSHINATLDGPKDQISVCVYLSESRAQKLATRLRQQATAGSVAVGFNKFLADRIGPILRGARPRRLRIVHAGMRPGQNAAAAMSNLPRLVPQAFVAKMHEWLMHGFTEFMKTQTQKFLAATEDPADGVSLNFTIESPPGLKELGQALFEKGKPASSVAAKIADGGRPNVRVAVFPRHHCG
jgi:hypothetical protein